MEAARYQFQMSRSASDGSRVADHMAVVRRMGMPVPEPPAIPSSLSHVWRWFCELSSARVTGHPITYEAMDAWSRLTGTVLRPDEVRLIHRLDLLSLEVARG